MASFDVPHDPAAPLFIEVMPLGGQVMAMRRVSRDSFSSLIARVGDRVVARVPLAPG